MHRLATAVDGHCYRHVFDLKLVDGLHAEIGKGHGSRFLDGLRDQVGRAADRHQVDRPVLLDRGDGGVAALGLADHAHQAGLIEHHVGVLVHAGGGGGASRSDHLVAHRIDRTDIVNEAAFEVDALGQRLALGIELLDAFVGGIAAGEDLAVDEQGLAGLPCGDIGLGQAVGQALMSGGVKTAGPWPSRWKWI